jgi:hypothetical protein
VDNVNHPAHYTDGKIEVIDFIEDKNLNYHRGNAVKYIARAGKKDPAKEIEDMQKAAWYINREIDRLMASDNPITPDTEDKPVEPWGEEDDARQNRLICDDGCCIEPCLFNENGATEGVSCNQWCELHPAEARKIMDEMEGEAGQ